MSLAWFDVTAGASGDMLLGALLDAGAGLAAVAAAVDAIGAPGIRLATRPVRRHGLAATKLDVHTEPDAVPRTWPAVRGLLEQATLPEPVARDALGVFARLAAAEGTVHGIPPEQVHFHEVGALDAIADVVGVCAALHALGVTQVAASAVALGSGTTRTAHGVLPVPVPAVLALLTAVGAPILPGLAELELCTPTGAALLATLATRFGAPSPMRLTGSGTGAGSRDLPGNPNVVRVLLGDPVEAAPGAAGAVRDLVVLETTVDDLDPRLWPEVLSRLLAAGAADTWLTPVLMKKGRPGHVLTVLSAPENAGTLRELVFRETTTLGIREHPVERTELVRDVVEVQVGGRAIAVKRGRLHEELVTVQPEYADVLAASAALGLALDEVLTAARSRALDLGP